MRVIILRGRSDSGKSTTLNLVYNELISSRYIRTVLYKNAIGSSDNSDFEAEVILTDHRVVGFYTMGDYDRNYIVKAINDFSNTRVDVLIIASNKDKMTHFNHVVSKFPYRIVNKTVID